MLVNDGKVVLAPVAHPTGGLPDWTTLPKFFLNKGQCLMEKMEIYEK